MLVPFIFTCTFRDLFSFLLVPYTTSAVFPMFGFQPIQAIQPILIKYEIKAERKEK